MAQIEKNIWERLEEIREYLGLNRGKFAEVLGIAPQNYIRLFPSQGETLPRQNPAQFAQQIFKIGISANWFLGGIGPMLVRDCERRCTCADVRKYVDVAEEMLQQIKGKLGKGEAPLK